MIKHIYIVYVISKCQNVIIKTKRGNANYFNYTDKNYCYDTVKAIKFF